MLNHPTLSKLQSMKFHGMARAFAEQLDTADIGTLDFDDRFGLLVDREWTERHSRQLSNRLRRAKLRHPGACMEDIDYRHPRGLDKALIASLGSCQWLRERLDVLITAPTGLGKSWLACALAHQACRDGFSALYLRLPRLLTELDIGRGDGRYPKMLASLAKTDLLILDDWCLTPMTATQRRDLLEIIEERHTRRSTIATSQLPVDKWHDFIGDPTLADAILDRLVHSAYRFNLKGESMRKRKSPLTRTEQPSS
jgi:DNA replication protein DnaC